MRVALDLDMTLNNMAYTWADWLITNVDPEFTLQDVRYFSYVFDAYGAAGDAYWKDPTAYDGITPLPGAHGFLRSLYNLGYEPFILTHTPEGQCSDAKDAWILRHFGDIEVIHSENKFEHTEHCLLVDDNPAHVQRHIRFHEACHGVVYNHAANYNWARRLTKHDRVTECYSYAMVLELLKELEEMR
jgi:phosphoglycolate phosphatase-like HAD superfamily hydrolase